MQRGEKLSNTRQRNKKRPQKKINHLMRGKLVGLFAVVLLALVCLLGRITYINATSGQKYKKQVLTQAQQKYESNILPAKRGDIYDELEKEFLSLEIQDSELSERISEEKIKDEFAQMSFPAKFLMALSENSTELQMAYDLVKQIRE